MRERLDCAVISTQCADQHISPRLGMQLMGKLYLHSMRQQLDLDDTGSLRALASLAMPLQRFDACIIPVSGKNLAWMRTALSAARGVVQTPIIALTDQLKAAALDDLYNLGLADFVRAPLCLEELRVRIEHLLDRRRYTATETPPVAACASPAADPGVFGGNSIYPLPAHVLCDTIQDRSGLELEAFAVASASRCATSRESFRAAKSQVVARFERAYIKAALGRHSGNIAMAARSAQKHRRAFWALMRKHDIDASVYRLDHGPHVQDG
jgi:DNA-binding NtrC family response regulator